MTTAETFGVAGAVCAVLVGMIQALIAYVYTSNKGTVDKVLGALQEQNRLQALDIERLKQQIIDASRHDDRVEASLERLNDKVDRLTGDIATLRRLGSGGGGSGPGTMPAVR